MTKQTEAREQLAQAQQALKNATQAEHKVREHHQKILDSSRRVDDLQVQLEDMHNAHSQTLLKWATDGAEGAPPAPPEGLMQIERDLANARASAKAADIAAQTHAKEVEAASQRSVAALEALRHARRKVIGEIVQPMIEEYREAKLREYALMEHILGLQAIARELGDEVPSIGDLTHRIGAALNLRPVLEHGGADKSRNAWRGLVRSLFDDPSATLRAAPEAVDPDAHLPRKAVA